MSVTFPDFVAAQAFQATQVGYLERGDVPGLLAHCYAPDARLHSFGFRAQGYPAIGEVLATYLGRLAELGPRTIDKFAAGSDYIWLEISIEQPGVTDPIKVYEVKFVRDGKIYLQLLGLKQGTPWQPGDLAHLPAPPPAPAARAFHERYLDYHRQGDADGLANDFFAPDARLVTGQVDVSGRPAIRQLFRDLFAREAGFAPLSVEHITSDVDYVWFEATVASSLGQRQVYDVMLRPNGDLVSRQLVGQLSGTLPTDAAFGPKAGGYTSTH